MMIFGNLVRAQNEARAGDEAVDLVPKSWQLVRRRPGVQPEVVAKGVLSFDLFEDGSIIYSNGNAIWRTGAKGGTERVVVARMIEQVVALDSVSPSEAAALQ
jgi:hypothetical protein